MADSWLNGDDELDVAGSTGLGTDPTYGLLGTLGSDSKIISLQMEPGSIFNSETEEIGNALVLVQFLTSGEGIKLEIDLF